MQELLPIASIIKEYLGDDEIVQKSSLFLTKMHYIQAMATAYKQENHLLILYFIAFFPFMMCIK